MASVLVPKRTILGLTNDPQMVELRKFCGIFCTVAIKPIANKWLVIHNDRRIEVDLGDVTATKAWLKALHFMSNVKTSTSLDISMFDTYTMESNSAVTRTLAGTADFILLGGHKFKGEVYADLANDNLNDLQNLYAKREYFTVVSFDGVVVAKCKITELQTMGGYQIGGRDTSNIRVHLTFEGDGYP